MFFCIFSLSEKKCFWMSLNSKKVFSVEVAVPSVFSSSLLYGAWTIAQTPKRRMPKVCSWTDVEVGLLESVLVKLMSSGRDSPDVLNVHWDDRIHLMNAITPKHII